MILHHVFDQTGVAEVGTVVALDALEHFDVELLHVLGVEGLVHHRVAAKAQHVGHSRIGQEVVDQQHLTRLEVARQFFVERPRVGGLIAEGLFQQDAPKAAPGLLAQAGQT
ncbi:hypothetical protein ABS71_19780 [bacterium SCN 62-11]|nr:MAG: hypothetical protein ABS71_19780 [bacterium SCN 62-11]